MELNAAPNGEEVFDRHGDLKLVVGEDKVVFRVCSRSLARSSPYWETLLYGPFAEGETQQKTDDWEVALPQDDPEALRIILLAVHHRLNEIPRETMELGLRFRITELCDKYDMIATLEPFWDGWLPSIEDDEDDMDCATLEELTKLIWSCHKIGDMVGFRHAIVALIRRAATLDDGRLCLESDESSLLDTDCYLESLELVEELKQARRAALKTMGAKVKQTIDVLISSSAASPKCIAPRVGPRCGSVMLGSLHRAMASQEVEEWYYNKMEGLEDQPHLTICDVSFTLYEIKRGVERAIKRDCEYGHEKCSPWTETDLLDFDKLPELRDLLASREEYMRKQAKKSGLSNTF